MTNRSNMPSRIKSRPFRVDILTAFMGLLILTVLLIVGYLYYESERTVRKVSAQLIDQLTNRVIDETIAHLSPSVALAGIGARLKGNLPVTRDRGLESYAMEILKSFHQLAMCNIGDEAGNFLMHKRMGDGTIATKVIDRSMSPPAVIWRYRDRDGKVIRQTRSSKVAYDPRTRSWYRGAKRTGKPYWSDLYVFHTDKEPGITASSPILDKRGGCAGVFGLDVELKELSGFLKTLRIGESGMGFIVNHKDELVAYPDFSQVVKHGTAGFRVATVQEVTEPAVRTCFSQHTKKGGGDFTFVCEGKHYLASVRAFPESFAKDWRMVVVVPKDDFVGILKRANRVTVLISLLFLGIAAGVSLALSRRISRPILTLSKDMQQIKDFDLEGQTDLSSPVKEIQIMANAMSSMRKGLRAFRRYVPADLVRQLIQTGQEARLGGEKRELTILFTDITGFTDVSEDMDPEELMLHYSEYLKALTDIIMAHHGTIDKYTGDGIMAFWGAPVHDPRHAFSACQGTLACCHKVLELNEKWKQEGKKPLPTRFGLHTGETIVGNMGSSERMNYSALGDSVNLASRLESANKTYGTAIMVSENTFRLVSDDFLFRPLDIIVVKGRKKGIKVYELMAEKGDKSAFEKEALCMDFIQGFDRYLQKDWEGAISIFEKLRERFPWDRPAEIYLKRCTAFRQSPPGAHWNGIVHLDQK